MLDSMTGPRPAPFPQAVSPLPSADFEAAARETLERRDFEGTLELLMDLYGGPLHRFCRHQLGDPDLADEVHQTTFVQAFDALPRFERRSSFKTWLFGIARHRCLDAAKIRRRRERRFELTDRLPEAPAPAPTPEEQLDVRWRDRALTACLDGLAPRVRASVLLRFQQGLSYVEMSRLGGERAPTLQARVVRALPALKRCLEGKGVRP